MTSLFILFLIIVLLLCQESMAKGFNQILNLLEQIEKNTRK